MQTPDAAHKRSDWGDEGEYLLFVLNASAILTFVAACIALYVQIRADGSDLAPFGVVFVGIIAGRVLHHFKRVRAGALAYLCCLSLGIALYIAAQPTNAQAFILLMLPVALTLLLLHPSDLGWMTPFAFAVTCAVLAARGLLADSMITLAVPAITLAIGAAALGTYGWAKNRRLEWALTTQIKDTKRAADFYDQSEILERALREVQWYSARLESMNHELEEARRIAESASNAKSTFLSNMSHELRTPLNMVIGYTSSMLTMPQMYRHQPLPDVYRKDIALIHSSGQHLLGLINDVLDLSKIEAGKLELQCAATDLNEIFDGVIATATGLVKDKPVQLRQDFAADLPTVWADPLRIRQILLNLLSNAIKFTDTGSVTLQACVADGQVQIAVIDTGIGIPQDALKSIFERYEQVRGQKMRMGTGLGLDISQRLAELHGTHLTVESIQGQGSTFAFSLPLTTPEQDAEGSPTVPSRAAPGIKVFEPTAAAAQVRTILLVEDESDMRRQIHKALEAQGHLVVDMHEGELALEMAQTLQPDVILLDMSLQGMSGGEVLRALADSPLTQSIPVIILGEAGDEVGSALPRVAKPISIGVLSGTIDGYLGVEVVR